jgi:hypothetical protein
MAGRDCPRESWAGVANRVVLFENGPTRTWFDPVLVEVAAPGGHFTGWENPKAVIQGIRETLRRCRR